MSISSFTIAFIMAAASAVAAECDLEVVSMFNDSNRLLSTKAQYVDMSDERQLNAAQDLTLDLSDAMSFSDMSGGLSAPQIGSSLRAFVYSWNNDPGNVEAVFNPIIHEYGLETVKVWETCMSLHASKKQYAKSPEKSVKAFQIIGTSVEPLILKTGDTGYEKLPIFYQAVKTTRSKWVRVEYTGFEGEVRQAELRGYAAAVFQHLYEHLDGVSCLCKPGAEVRTFRKYHWFQSFVKTQVRGQLDFVQPVCIDYKPHKD